MCCRSRKYNGRNNKIHLENKFDEIESKYDVEIADLLNSFGEFVSNVISYQCLKVFQLFSIVRFDTAISMQNMELFAIDI